MEGAEALERGRAEFACARGLVSWLDDVAKGRIPTAAARLGLGSGRLAPTFNPVGYCSRIPRADRRNPDDGFGFEEVVAGLRELADPPAPPAKPPELRPVAKAA